MKQRQHTTQLVSAGGVVYRTTSDGIDIVICGRNPTPIWSLPKGTPNPGESHVQTALREVHEETGLEVKIQAFIGNIDYWFFDSADNTRYHKTVYFYLMSAIGGDVTFHDHEFDIVTWCPADEALNSLSYENEIRIVKNGLSLASKKAPDA